MQEPKYIVLEGADGTGTTAHSTLLAEKLGAVLVKEPDEFGDFIRSKIKTDPLPPWQAMLYLFHADRMVLQAKIRKHLAEGRTVVSDRSIYSSYVYQCLSAGDEFSKARREVYQLASGILHPDGVIVLDVRDEIATQRLLKRGAEPDAYEKSSDFRKSVLEEYRNLPTLSPKTKMVYVISEAPKDQVSDRILNVAKVFWP